MSSNRINFDFGKRCLRNSIVVAPEGLRKQTKISDFMFWFKLVPLF